MTQNASYVIACNVNDHFVATDIVFEQGMCLRDGIHA